MPMRATTVRFSDDLWSLLEREAVREGVSAAQFVRDATVMRVAYGMGRRGDASMETAMARVSPPVVLPAPVRGSTPPGNGRALPALPALPAAGVLSDPERLAAVAATGLLDAPPQPRFDRLTELASQVLGAPVALISMVADDRQVFASCLGLPEPWQSQRATPMTHSFCQHVVASREPLIVDDAREHLLLRENPAIRDLHVVAYAGIPLIDSGGHALGSLCAIDTRPRVWTGPQVAILQSIASSVVTELELDRLRRAAA